MYTVHVQGGVRPDWGQSPPWPVLHHGWCVRHHGQGGRKGLYIYMHTQTYMSVKLFYVCTCVCNVPTFMFGAIICTVKGVDMKLMDKLDLHQVYIYTTCIHRTIYFAYIHYAPGGPPALLPYGPGGSYHNNMIMRALYYIISCYIILRCVMFCYVRALTSSTTLARWRTPWRASWTRTRTRSLATSWRCDLLML